jgi:UrcA family protein
MKRVAFAIAAVAMAGAVTTFTTSPAFAGTTQAVTIDASAYNLRTASGYSAMTGRIDRASKQVCGTVDVRNISGAHQVRSCQAEAVDNAMAQLGNIAGSPTVTVGASR